MSAFAFLLLCIQACLIQDVFSQCLGNGGYGYNNIRRGYGLSGYNGLGFADDFSYGAGYGARKAAAGAAGSALGAGWGAAGAGWGAAGAGWGAAGAGWGAAGADLGAAGISDGLGGPGFGYPGAYGSLGDGNMYVAGELPVTGTTLVSGAVPILGDVSFFGNVPAAGTVSISGHSGCTCGREIIY